MIQFLCFFPSLFTSTTWSWIKIHLILCFCILFHSAVIFVCTKRKRPLIRKTLAINSSCFFVCLFFLLANFYKLSGSLDALLCGNGSDAGWVHVRALSLIPTRPVILDTVLLNMVQQINHRLGSAASYVNISVLKEPCSLIVCNVCFWLVDVQKVTCVWRLDAIQTTATPALTALAGRF